MAFLRLWLMGILHPAQGFEELKAWPGPRWGFIAVAIRFVGTTLTTGLLAIALHLRPFQPPYGPRRWISLLRYICQGIVFLATIVLVACEGPAPTATSTTFAGARVRVQTATYVPTVPTHTNTPVLSATLTLAATSSRTPLPTATPTPTVTHTSTPSLAATPTCTPTATDTPTATRTPRPTATRTLTPLAPRVESPPAVLANYFPWYDPRTWDTGCTSDSDRPRDGAYNSDDGAVIARHIAQARAAGLDGLAVHWLAAGDRTDTNFRQVLDGAPDGFCATVTFLYHILPGVQQQGVVDALRYIINEHSQHPRFFRVAGKQVLLFSDLYRVPDANGARPASDRDVSTAIATWQAIRQAVDPDHLTWWIAEGLQADYMAVFDGLYVYKVDHACCPNAYESASRWAGWVRDWARRTGQPKLWVATVMPGWDDLNSAQAQCVDLRVSSEPFARDRADGAYYERTWQAALASEPDFVLVHSFNEWVEGSYIEPSVKHGDRYLALTAQWVAKYKPRQ